MNTIVRTCLALVLLAPAPLRAQLLEMRQTIFGMD